jgi:hypothetical protein
MVSIRIKGNSKQQVSILQAAIEKHDTLVQNIWVYETLRRSWSDSRDAEPILACRPTVSVNTSRNNEHGVRRCHHTSLKRKQR